MLEVMFCAIIVTIGTTADRRRVVGSEEPVGPSDEACPGPERPRDTLAGATAPSGLIQD